MNLATIQTIGEISPTLIAIILWSLCWKGLGLWHSAKHNQKWWFVAILFINTMGILEIIYLFFFLKLKLTNLFPKD